MKTIKISQFKEQCLSLLDRLDEEGLIVTKHGRPVARVLPVAVSSSSLIGCLKSKLKVKGDVFSTGLKWHAES
ncbi:MAG: type II toxin-antitoxin system Phd/YefM family antitoxin [Planctomycetes bacterium]|nr:type II toxin-antitoxin system Phd/YefM family antitoxin [Planctomycetota bacterium]